LRKSRWTELTLKCLEVGCWLVDCGGRLGTEGMKRMEFTWDCRKHCIGVYGKAIKLDYHNVAFPANLIHDGSDEVLELSLFKVWRHEIIS
jgi:hypothetical protein